MHPTLVARPFHREGWIYEEKHDGWRLVGYKRDGQVRLLSRNHRDHTQRFPALAAAIAALAPTTLILDGEVAVFDTQLISRFEWLRQRDPAAGHIRPKCRSASSMASRFSGGHGSTRRRRAAPLATWRVGTPRSALT
jgi:ATP-dependent DNA ligase